MTRMVELPLWVLLLLLLFAAVTFASHFLFPSVRWFFRRRAERVVAELNKRLERPIQPFKLLRRQDMIQRVIFDAQVTQAVTDHAKMHGVREDVAFETARRYAREIVPSFSASAYFGFATRAARLVSTLVYDIEVVREEQALADIHEDATVVFVMNHRSNMDYVLVTYLAARQSALSYAVGEWARVWPLSRLIRAMGAYFIRRKTRNALYRKVLARYVVMATRAGVTQAMFPEGGLSRDGGLGKPKLGIYSYLVEAHQTTGRDVVFVPVSLTYDRVIEDRILVAAHGVAQPRFRATLPEAVGFVWTYLWARLTGRLGRFGRAAVVFGTPLSLGARSGPVEAGALAAEMERRIAAQMPVLPVPLACAALLSLGGTANRDGLSAEMGRLRSLLPPSVPVFLPDTDVVADPLRTLLARGILSEDDGRLTVAEPGLVAFYARSVALHLPEDVQVQHSAET